MVVGWLTVQGQRGGAGGRFSRKSASFLSGLSTNNVLSIPAQLGRPHKPSTMASQTSFSSRFILVLLFRVFLLGRSFIIPLQRSRLRPTASRSSCHELYARRMPWSSMGCVRRSYVRPVYMVSDSPNDEGSDSQEEYGGNDGEAGADAGEPGDDTSQASPLYGETGNEMAPLKLISRGDTLPLSYRSDNGTRESEFFIGDEKENVNPYYDVVRRLSPTELIGQFMRTSSPRVQEAVRTTVLGLLGSLPRHAFETTAIGTGDALANLMFQLQMTGYMFKNAEYRLSLQSSVRAPTALLPGNVSKDEVDDDDDDDGGLQAKRPKISGKIKLTFNAEQETEQSMEVDADAYMAELRGQVEKLENKLLSIQNQKDEAIKQDLLTFIKSMPENQLKGLTARVSPEVLEAMQLLVEAVMGGMADREILRRTLTQQTGSGMAQLCMWQLVVGFNLREMEAREDLRKKFFK